jgi:hypothetical protein
MTSLLLSRPGDSCAQVADWFGAMQSQDLGSGKWSLGLRLGLTEAQVDAALADGEVLRTWPMRRTIHTVLPANTRWLLDLTGVRAFNGVQKRWEVLGLDRDTAHRAAEVLAEALSAGPLTRTQCLAALAAKGIPAAEKGWAYHLLWHTCQLGISCIGPTVGGEQTFVLLEQWAPEQRHPDDPLAALARRYFQSHGPTTVKDFQGWTGLTMTDARKAVTAADLAQDDGLFYFPSDVADLPKALLLPGFDEYLLGFKDRSLFMAPAHFNAVVPGGNGMFKATAVHQGRVIGTWQRRMLSKKVVLTITPLVNVSVSARRAFESPAQDYSTYLGRPVDVHWSDSRP